MDVAVLLSGEPMGCLTVNMATDSVIEVQVTIYITPRRAGAPGGDLLRCCWRVVVHLVARARVFCVEPVLLVLLAVRDGRYWTMRCDDAMM